MLPTTKHESLRRILLDQLGKDAEGALFIEGALEMSGKFGLDGLMCITPELALFAADDIIEGAVLYRWPRAEVRGMILTDDVLGPMLSFSSDKGEIKLTRIAGDERESIRAALRTRGYLGEQTAAPVAPELALRHEIPEPGASEAATAQERQERSVSVAAAGDAGARSDAAASGARQYPPAFSGGAAAAASGQRQYPSAFDGGAASAAAPVFAPTPGGSFTASKQQTSTMAILSLVFGAVSFFSCCFFFSIPAWILGAKAEGEIDRSQGTLGGRGAATAGKWIGICMTVLTLLLWGVYFVAILAGAVS